MRLLGGWALAIAVGVPLGVLIGRSRIAADLTNPSLQFLRAIPGPALIPVFIILLGTEATMRVTLIAFGSVWPILLNTIEGTRTVDPVQLDTARAYRLPPMRACGALSSRRRCLRSSPVFACRSRLRSS